MTKQHWIIIIGVFILGTYVAFKKGKESSIPAPYVDAETIDPEELKKGIEVEYEHTTDYETARKIALAHLAEKSDYYNRLTEAGL